MEKAHLLASAVLAMTLTACASFNTCDGQNCSGDDKLSSLVLQQINSHPALETDRLRVQTANGVVYLNGITDTWVEYYEAEEVARAVPGVLKVVNKIAVNNRYG